MESTFRLAPLAQEHVEQILVIENQVHGAPWSERSFLHEITNQHSIFLVALVQGKVVGYGGCWVLVDEAHIINVAVTPEMRRKGIAKAIVSQLLSKSIPKGATCATLEVRISNEAARNLYESFGFTFATIRKSYYPDNKEDAIVMTLNQMAGVINAAV
jgi:ribosomal-protein-alanine N-acetyltransferase